MISMSGFDRSGHVRDRMRAVARHHFGKPESIATHRATAIPDVSRGTEYRRLHVVL